MLVIELELLTGRYAATAHNDRGRAEWPPHPARFFSALVAALHDQEPVNPLERQALLWLEKQPPPALDVDLSVDERTGRRAVLEVYVPVNDSKLPRKLQARTFPVIVPGRSTFALVWETEMPAELREPLGALCARTTRLGHSSSLVRCIIVNREVTPNLRPDPDGDRILRVFGPGQLARLELEHERHQQVESRVLFSPPQAYSTVGPPERREPAVGVFTDEWVLFQREDGARPLSSRGVDLTRALRLSIIEMNGKHSLPGPLSGHRSDGTPEVAPHLAFVAFPFVGHPHADGSIQGCAMVLPRGLPVAFKSDLFRLVVQWEHNRGRIDGPGHPLLELASGSLPPVVVRRVLPEDTDKVSLRPRTWCGPSAHYISATPIALDKYPGNLRSNREHTAHKAAVEAQSSIADACEHIGLPRPVYVEVSFAPLLSGAQHVHEFPPWPGRGDRPSRVRVHADIRFDRPVSGPVILGAGRYLGMGLCLPVSETG